MKTKEEVIKEAWGVDWQIVKDTVSENGYVNQNIEVETECDIFCPLKRPKSLRGLENNDGWISIESEEDLPIDSNDYWVYDVNKNIDIRFYMSFSKKWGGHEMEVDVPEITHYQAIVKPKPPLY